MSICRGVAGLRGGNPRGIFIHNDQDHKMQMQRFTENGCKRIR